MKQITLVTILTGRFNSSHTTRQYISNEDWGQYLRIDYDTKGLLSVGCRNASI